jgi:hypothetical protein
MNAYEQKIEARRARLENRAQRLRKAGQARYDRATSDASLIPFGQPILVGHHSERRDRNFRARIEGNFRKGFDLIAAAEHAEERAASVGHGGISSDDPDATAKLTAKLNALVARADQESKWNRQIAQGGAAAIVGMGELEVAEVARMVAAWPYMQRGYFHVSNRRAEIRRLKGRIEQLACNVLRAPTATIEGADGVRIVENVEANRLQIVFPDKPDIARRAKLKSYGFRWAPSEGAWQRQLNNAARHAASCALSGT